MGVVRPGSRPGGAGRWGPWSSSRCARATSGWPATSRWPGCWASPAWRSWSGPWVYRLSSDLDRRAGGAGPHPGARRPGRAPARLGAADPRADPEERRRTGPLVARLARSQERDLRAWLYADEAERRQHRRRPRCGRSRPPSRTTTGRRRRWSASATARSTSSCGRVVSATREAVTNAAKHAGTGRVDVYAEVSADAASTSSSATGAPASTRTPCRTTGSASATASSTAWSGTAGPPRSGPRPARAPRCGCTCRDRETDD